MDTRALVRVAVDLDDCGEQIRGRLDDGAGPPIEFTGWLELMSGFETVCGRAREATDQHIPKGTTR